MNVDLLKSNNMTLDTQSKAILINSAKSIMESFSNLDLVGLETNVKVTEKERGWYDGSTMREFPYIVDHDTYNYQLETSRPSGSFVTPHFKEEFNDKKFMKVVTYQLTLHKDPAVNLTIDIDLDTIEVIGTTSSVEIELEEEPRPDKSVPHEDSHDKGLLYSFPNSGPVQFSVSLEQSVVIRYQHTLLQSQLEHWANKRMVGMRVSWQSQGTSNVSSPGKFLAEGPNIQMRRLANILDSQADLSSVWRLVEQVRIDWLTEVGYTYSTYSCVANMISQKEQEQLVDRIILNLNLTDDTSLNVSIKNESLKAAADMQFYLFNCPRQNWIELLQFLTSLITGRTPRMLLATTNSLLTKAQQLGRDIEAEAFRAFLDKLTDLWSLDHENLSNFINHGKRLDSLGKNNIAAMSHNHGHHS